MINKILTFIKEHKYKFIDDNFNNYIIQVIDKYIPLLNKYDKDIITNLTIFLMEIISNKYHFDNNNENYYNQWKLNNNRDIKSVLLLLLPFIDDTKHLLNYLLDLNHLLYSQNTNYISKNILEFNRDDIYNSHFKYGNMAIGLLNENNDNLLELFDENTDKLIYKLIHHNLIGLLISLEIMNGKYYVNWINIEPLNLDNYQESKLYINTFNHLKYIEAIDINDIELFNKLESKNLIYYSGLWIGEFYNILFNRFYNDILKIKFLIFAYEYDNNNIYLIQGLNNMLDINEIIKMIIPIKNNQTLKINNVSNDYEQNDIIEYSDVISFLKNKFNNIINNLNNNIFINSLNIDENILTYFLIYLINNKKFKDKYPFNKFKLDINDNKEETDDFKIEDNKIINKIKKKDILKCIEDINNNDELLLETLFYINEIFYKLKYSSYGKYLIDKKDNNYFINNYYFYSDEYKINLKNIYNIVKTLVHTTYHPDSNYIWMLMSSNYISLIQLNKYFFFKKILNYDLMDIWLNLKGNYKKQYNIIFNKQHYDNFIIELLNNFKNIFVNLVFEDLICSGLLNKFKPIELDKPFEIDKIHLDSYYYLTNEKYKELNNEEYDYFNITVKEEWYTLYSMNWISQINFFHHYIYHQIIYVTGAPGQGKSTQVPKLLLYSLKCIDYKYSNKVICTQPRQDPTQNNAIRISVELGTPIENNNEYQNNFYIQYQHKVKKHINTDLFFNQLIIYTDGLFDKQFNNNITLFKKIISDKLQESSDNDMYINENLFDIIIIDEAHEHNTNMDLILTLLRQSCYFNNKIKLIIVSATMDDDEPIYRRYYKTINDNLMYPIKYPILNPLTNETNFLPNSTYMDRRYHISPPGETTLHKVIEIYLDKDINCKTDKLASIEANKIGIKKIIDICKNKITGHILFFTTGEPEIKTSVEELNKNTPSNIIALPFFGQLNSKYKEIILNIHKDIHKIRNNKNKINNEWGRDYIENICDVPLNTYKYAIIIATNVAEASITIINLQYVIDNGYAKINRYNSEYNFENLEIEKISESSRIQRKGRTGRKNKGTVYYMYAKNSRKNIKTKYNITLENFSYNFIKLLNEGSNLYQINQYEDKNYHSLIINDIFNYNNLNIITKLKTSYLNEVNINYFIISSNIIDIHNINYKMNFMKNEIYYDDYIHDYYKYNCFYNGQLTKNVLDIQGDFYIIHYLENKIKRNIINKIISYDEQKNNCIPISEYTYILKNLYYNNLIIDYNINNKYDNNNFIYKLINNKKNYYLDDIIFIKTNFYKFLKNLSDTSELFEKTYMYIVLFYGCVLNVENEIYLIIELIILINYIITNIAEYNKFDKLKKNYYLKYNKHINSDLIFLYEIIKKVMQFKKDNKIELIKWAKDNYFNDSIIDKIHDKIHNLYDEKLLFNKNIKKKNIINTFEKIKNNEIIKKLNITINKLLKTDSIEEKIIRSFIFSCPDQYLYSNNNKDYYKFINNNISNVPFNPNNTMITNNNNLLFYYNIGIDQKTDDKSFYLFSNVDIEWILPANFYLFNNKFNLEYNINNNDVKECLNNFKHKLLNNFNRNNFLWNDSIYFNKHNYQQFVNEIL